MLRGFKQQNEKLAHPEPTKVETVIRTEKVETMKEEEKKASKGTKSPFNQKDKHGAASPPKTFGDDEIEEDIIQDIEDI